MKCSALKTRWNAGRPCPMNAVLDGYCVHHHPIVLLAKSQVYAARKDFDQAKHLADVARYKAEIECLASSAKAKPAAQRTAVNTAVYQLCAAEDAAAD